jgi:CDP-glucose 4,6-dehydratase
MENMGLKSQDCIKMFQNIYNGQRVFLTGHTGFKGSWLALWLSRMGAQVTGFSLDPVGLAHEPHFNLLSLPLVADIRGDIRDAAALQKAMQSCQPTMVFHLAAQPLVRRSYRDPLETWQTNVIGTANVLEACRQTASVKVIVSVTTDKCYENQEWLWAYRENDRLGGHDPYSASKAACELVASSYRQSFFHAPSAPLLATARAGNVIGGGDWSEDRLIPDFFRAVNAKQSLEIRSPQATRPWQHVLESLSGYLLLGQKLLQGQAEFAAAWNFGPDDAGNQTVSYVLNALQKKCAQAAWHQSKSVHPHEASLLHLDSTQARHRLGWRPVWALDDGIEKTADWYLSFLNSAQIASSAQLDAYSERAAQLGLVWAHPSLGL